MLGLQALYQWQLAAQPLAEIEQQFVADEQSEKADLAFFRELLHQIPAHRDELDAAVLEHLSRAAETMDPVERAVLWIGTYELLHRHDVPYRVAINEAVDLSKRFGAEQGYRFVNGVLDKVAKEYRRQEIATECADRLRDQGS